MTTLAYRVPQKSLMKNFITESLERKKIEQILVRISSRGWFAIPLFNTSSLACILTMTTLACRVTQKSLTKNVIIQSMERKNIGQIQEKISNRRLAHNPTVQYTINNHHTKYDYPSLQGFIEIFDENFHYLKYGKKENRTNSGKNKQQKAGLQCQDTTYCH